jgi:5-keto 4-deoxyuronate isomerase
MEEMVRRLSALETSVRRLQEQRAVYTVVNVGTAAQLTADQNNYDVGAYDLVLLSSNASRTITGIANGVRGRLLHLVNIGSNNIVLAHASGSSLAANQIYVPGGASLTMSPFSGAGNARGVMLYYTNAWGVLYRSVP